MHYNSTRVIALNVSDGSDYAEHYPGCEFAEGTDGSLRILDGAGACCAIYRAGCWAKAERYIEPETAG